MARDIGEDGVVSLQTALRAYVVAIGPLPGVEVPAGRRQRVISGSGALRWVLGRWQELTEAQRDAIVERLGASPFTGSAGGVRGRSRVGSRKSSGSAASEKDASAFGAVFDAQAKKIEQKLGFPLGIEVEIVLDKKDVGTGDAYTFVQAPSPQAKVTGCVVHLSPKLQQAPDNDVEVALAHEAFHCFQGVMADSWQADQDTTQAAPWVIEGQAAWVCEEVAGPESANGWSRDWWEDYLTTPLYPLTQRGYDAIGFYAHMAESGIDVWSTLAPMVKAKGNKAAFAAATQPALDPFRQTWASSLFRQASLGRAWDTTGVAIPGPAVHGESHSTSVSSGQSVPVKVGAYRNGLYEVTSTADVVEVTVWGAGRVGADGVDVVAVDGAPARICTRSGGCACPGESGPAFPEAKGMLRLGVSAMSDGASGSVNGQSLQDACEKKKQNKGITWCDAVKAINRKHGYLVGDPPQYLPTSKVTVELMRAIIDETLANEGKLLAITPAEIMEAQRVELDAFHSAQAAGYGPGMGSDPRLKPAMEALLAYQVSHCGILPPPS